MDMNENIMPGRRGFICALSGLLSGLLFVNPARLRGKKTKIKNLLGNLEIEVLEKSRPIRHASITWNTYGDRTILWVKTKGETRPMSAMNQVGKTIWEGCNGENTPRDISKVVCKKYQVSSHQAYVDCLAFLARLKAVEAIQV